MPVSGVHVVFSTARFKGGGKPCPKTRKTAGLRRKSIKPRYRISKSWFCCFFHQLSSSIGPAQWHRCICVLRGYAGLMPTSNICFTIPLEFYAAKYVWLVYSLLLKMLLSACVRSFNRPTRADCSECGHTFCRSLCNGRKFEFASILTGSWRINVCFRACVGQLLSRKV